MNETQRIGLIVLLLMLPITILLSAVLDWWTDTQPKPPENTNGTTSIT